MRKNMSIKKRSFGKKRSIRKPRSVRKKRSVRRMRGGRKRSVKKLRGGSDGTGGKDPVYATIGPPGIPQYEYVNKNFIQLERLEKQIGNLDMKIVDIGEKLDKVINKNLPSHGSVIYADNHVPGGKFAAEGEYGGPLSFSGTAQKPGGANHFAAPILYGNRPAQPKEYRNF